MSDVGGGEARYLITVDPSGVADVGDILADSIASGTQRAKREVKGLENVVAGVRRGVQAQARVVGRSMAQGIAQGLRSSSPSVQRAALNALATTQKAAAQQAAAAARTAVAAQTVAARAAAQQVRGAQQTAAQQARAQLQANSAASRQQLAQTVALGKQQAAITQGLAQQQVIAARVAGQRRVAIQRFVLDSLSRLERGFGRAVVGVASTTTGAIRRLYAGTVGSVQRSFAQRHSLIERSLRQETHLFVTAGKQVQAIQQKAQTGVVGISRRAGLGLGGGIAAGSLLTQGFQRAADIENVQKRLNVLLGNNVFAARALFLQLAAFARTTAFDLTGVSDLASRLLAANVAAEDILPNIKALSGAITLVGGTTDDLNGIARALGQIVSVGKLTAEEMNQISERLPGLNITQLFSDALGFATTSAFIEAREAGEISGEAAIDAFFRAMKFDPRFGQALAEGANTFSNLRANAIESFADVGASIVERFEKPIKAALKGTVTAFSGLASFIRGGELSGGMETLRLVAGKLGVALLGIVAAKGAAEVLGLLGRGVGLLLSPMGILVTVVAAAATAFGFFFQRSEAFRKIVFDIRDRVVAFARAVGTTLVRGLQTAVDALDDLRRITFGWLSDMASRLSVLGRFSGFLSQIFSNLAKGRAAEAFERVASAAKALGQNLAPIGRALANFRFPIAALVSGDFDRAVAGFKAAGRQLAEAVSEAFTNAMKSLDPFIDIAANFVSRFKAQFIGGGIGAVVGGLVGGPLGAALGAALGVAVSLAIPRIRDAISRINILDLFGRLLQGVREVGRRIALVLSDRRTFAAVGAVAAAAAALAFEFVRGFVTGIIQNRGEFAAVANVIFEALTNVPAAFKAAAALVILLRGAITGAFRSNAISQAVSQSLATQLNTGTQQAVKQATLGNKLRAAFSGLGVIAGQAPQVGLASALSGQALGEATSSLDQGLAFAGLAGSVAAGFAAAGPAGGAAALGVGILTTALSANAKASREAEERIKGYQEAIKEAGSEAGGLGLGLQLEQFGDLKEVLADVGFRVKDFQDAFAAGRSDEFIDQVRQRVLETSGSLVDATAITELLQRAIEDLGEAAERNNIEDALVGDGQGFATLAAGITGIINKAADAAREMRSAAAERRVLFQQQQSAQLEGALGSIRDKATEIGTEADIAREKLENLINPPSAADAQNQAVLNIPGITSQLSTALGGPQNVFSGAQAEQALSDLRRNASAAFAAAVQEGIKTGNPVKALEDSLAVQRLAIAQAPELTPEARETAIRELEAAFSTFKTDGIPLAVKASEIDARAAGVAARAQALEAAVQAGEIPIASAANIADAIASGGQIVQSADSIVRNSPAEVRARARLDDASAAGGQIASTADSAVQSRPISVGGNLNVDTGPAYQAGLDIAAGLRNGISAGTAQVAKQAAEAVDRAIIAARAAAGAASPSKVFMRLGGDIMDGLTLGIKEAQGGPVSAITDVVNAMIRQVRGLSGLGESVREGLGSLFSGFFDATRTRAGGNVLTAVQEFSDAVRNVRSTVQQNAETLFGIGAKKPEERSLSERLLLGESFTSLRIGDEFGSSNRATIATAVAQIREIGAALIEQGFSAKQASDQMLAYRSQLLLTAVNSGLAAAEVDRLISSLGLSVQNLQQFVSEANRLNAVVTEAQRRAKEAEKPPPPLTTGPNPVQQFIDIDMNLPTGDPQANALAVVNRLALSLR